MEDSRYRMVCAVVSARISPNYVEKIHSVRLIPRETLSLDINIILDFLNESCLCLPGTIVAESGDLYNMEIWRVKSILGRDLKYPETIAERMAVEMAHHISVAGRRLMIDAQIDALEDKRDE
ncbi:MAG: hypothetical protein A4E49_02947 [Methanosaeta sp. PtaU1.Bin112]|nr:MAG: hypothetical protein A4E49_02947 [Methanosaeta sp. PtaU1.Bin112]